MREKYLPVHTCSQKLSWKLTKFRPTSAATKIHVVEFNVYRILFGLFAWCNLKYVNCDEFVLLLREWVNNNRKQPKAS